MEFCYIAQSLNDTLKLAEILGSKLKSDDVILLDGDLGAGKTTFTKALAKSLGIDEVVNSPTFSIVNEYEFPNGTLYHLDLYRLDYEEELFDIGFEEYFSQEGIIIIEWAQKFISLIPEPYLEIYITKIDENKREFRITGSSVERIDFLIRELERNADSGL